MVHYHNYSLTPQEYASADMKSIVPVYNVCLNPDCRAVDRLYRHGYRERYAIIGYLVILILICRVKCRHCKKAFTILPSFLLKKFQHTAANIISFLKDFFEDKYSCAYRQLLYFYRKKFLSNINLFEMFFRDAGIREVLPGSVKEKAMRLIELILSQGVENFHQKFLTRFGKHFMTHNFAN